MNAIESVDALVELIRQNPETANYTGGLSPADMADAEALLDASFPPSYRRFLVELGSCEADGEEFLGIYRTPGMGEQLLGTVIETLEARRDLPLPHSLLIVQNDGMGGFVSLDVSRLDADGEAPVVVWDPGTPDRGEPELLATDFGSYALRACTRALSRG